MRAIKVMTAATARAAATTWLTRMRPNRRSGASRIGYDGKRVGSWRRRRWPHGEERHGADQPPGDLEELHRQPALPLLANVVQHDAEPSARLASDAAPVEDASQPDEHSADQNAAAHVVQKVGEGDSRQPRHTHRGGHEREQGTEDAPATAVDIPQPMAGAGREVIRGVDEDVVQPRANQPTQGAGHGAEPDAERREAGGLPQRGRGQAADVNPDDQKELVRVDPVRTDVEVARKSGVRRVRRHRDEVAPNCTCSTRPPASNAIVVGQQRTRYARATA
jgi:hypothetical protein